MLLVHVIDLGVAPCSGNPPSIKQLVLPVRRKDLGAFIAFNCLVPIS